MYKRGENKYSERATRKFDNLKLILFGMVFVGVLFFVLGVVNVGVDQGVNFNVTYENNFSHLNLTDGSLVFYNPFDLNDSAGTTYDYTNLSNDGTVNGATFNSTGGYYGGAYEFDGSDDYINIDGVVGDVAGSTTGAFSFWIKPTNSIPGSAQVLFPGGEYPAACCENFKLSYHLFF